MITTFMVIWTIVVATMNHIMMNITEIMTEIIYMIFRQAGVQQLPLEDPLVADHQERPETMWWVSSAFHHFENKNPEDFTYNFVLFLHIYFVLIFFSLY